MSHDRDLARAFDLLRRGELEAADAACRAVLAAQPGHPDALQLAGLVRKQAGDLDGAERAMRASIQAAPGRADFHANLGNLLRARQRPADAEFEYRMALHRDPAFTPAALGLARLLNETGHFAPAEAEARKLLAREPRNAEALVALGSALRGQRRAPEAEAAYRQALEIAPGYAAARHNLGALLGSQQRAEEALVELDRAAAAGARGRELAYNRGRALADLGRFEEAERAYAEAVAAAPAWIEAQVELAKLRFMRGDAAFARDLERAALSAPGHLGLNLALGDVLRRAGRPGSAEAILRSLLERTGFVPEVNAALAIVLHEQERLQEALDEARRARAGRPGDAAVDESLVGILLTLGEAGESLAVARHWRSQRPLDQRWIAYEASALRIVGAEEYATLYDYARFVRPYDLEPPRGWSSIEAFNADLIAVLGERHRFQAHPLDQSLRLGTQTPRSLLVDPDPTIRAFLEALQAPIAAYRESLGTDPAHPLLARNMGPARFVGCWSVRLRRGGYHVNHTHPEGWISSAYYVEVPPEVADEDARSGWIKFGEPGLPVPGALPERFVQPRPGRLVLFPSYMWHGTTPITGDAPRMTVAFDVVPADTGPAPGG